MSEASNKHQVIVRKTAGEVGTGELRKAVGAVYAYPNKGKLTLVARKAFNLLLANAMKSGPSAEWYEIAVSDLARDIRFDSKDMRYLEDTLSVMQTTLLRWDVLETISGKTVEVRDSVQLLGAVRIIGGVSPSGERSGVVRTVRYRFDESVKQKLLVPEVYARINLQLQAEFRSSYTLALYEQVIRYKGSVSADGWSYTHKLPWREWRNLILGGDHAEIYEQYKYFSRDVLTKALKELNCVVAEFEFDVLVYKSGRLVSDLQFRLRGKKQQSLEFDDTRPIIDIEPISRRLQALGLKDEEIERLIGANDVAVLESAAEATETRLRRTDLTPIGNRAAYYHDTVKRMRGTAASEPKAKTSEGGAAQPEILDPTPGRSTGRGKPCWTVAEEWFRALPEDKAREIAQKFAEQIENPAVIAEFARKGVTAPLVRAAFLPWLEGELDRLEGLDRLEQQD